jgi:hypothetical protein
MTADSMVRRFSASSLASTAGRRFGRRRIVLGLRVVLAAGTAAELAGVERVLES